MTADAHHWNAAYTERPDAALTWFEETPEVSLRLVRRMMPPGGALVDVGGGASRLADHWLAAGPVTVLDLSAAALDATRRRMGACGPDLTLVVGDVRTWQPDRPYDLWHDRAVFHFLTDPDDQARYLATLDAALRPGGAAIIATFAPSGPAQCSGLPVQRYASAALAQRFETLAPGLLLPVHAEEHAHLTPKGAVQDFQVSVFRKKDTA